jgi:hypothetical protein
MVAGSVRTGGGGDRGRAPGLDYSTGSYAEWIEYLFLTRRPPDHDAIVPDPLRPLRLIAHLDRLCDELPRWRERVSSEKLNAGLWAAIAFPFELARYLVDPSLPSEPRITCIRRMPRAFSEVVAKIPPDAKLPTAFFMWWDLLGTQFSIAHGPSGGGPFTPAEPTARQVHDALLGAIVEVLHQTDAHSQRCALHGLGHLRHPEGPPLVREYLLTHGSELSPAERAWVEQCRDGTVM